MSQERLSGLAMLSIEIDICKHLSKNDIIDRFAAATARKVPFS